MALIVCTECKAQVSDTAKRCPSCGAKVPRKAGLFTWLFLGFFGFVVFQVASRSGDVEQQQAAESARVQKNAVLVGQSNKAVILESATSDKTQRVIAEWHIKNIPDVQEVQLVKHGPNSGLVFVDWLRFDGKSCRSWYQPDLPPRPTRKDGEVTHCMA